MLTQPNYCPPPAPIPASYIPLSKNKINDRAWGRALAAAAGDKVTPTVRQTNQEGQSHRLTLNSFSHRYIRELLKLYARPYP